MDDNKTTDQHWYAYKIYHNKIRDIKEQAEKNGLRYYMPMRTVLKTEAYNVPVEEAYEEEPIIPSLIFIRSNEEYVQRIRRDPNSHVRVYCYPGTTDPSIIPDHDMDIFIFATSSGCKTVEAINLNFTKGNRVRITGGVLKGAEGYITRVHGTKRLVVMIEGIAAIATAFIPKHFIENLSPTSTIGDREQSNKHIEEIGP